MKLVLFLILALVGCDKELSVLHSSNEGYIFEVNIPEPQKSIITLDGSSYTSIKFPGYLDHAAPGFPKIPYREEVVYVPEGRDFDLVFYVEGEEVVPLEHPLEFQHYTLAHPSETVSQNKHAYQYAYGKEAVVVAEEGFAGKEQLVRLRLYPASFEDGSFTIRKKISVSLKFAPTTKTAQLKSSGIAQYIALNRDIVPLSKGVQKDFVIAHEDYKDVLDGYLSIKKSFGRDVEVQYVSNKSAQEIKNIIKGKYESSAPSHTMLIGNIDQIPSWRGSGDNSWTDFNYTTLDSDEVPDISLGRVPAHTDDEVLAFVEKAIARELRPININDVLLTAGRDVSLGCPANIKRVGEKIQSASPLVKLIKKLRSEGSSTSDVIDAYNANPNFAFYDGHGDRSGMLEIPLTISSLDKLSNFGFPIIFDIACLNANWGRGADVRNFAEMILLRPNAGVSGILASGGSGYGHDFFQTIGELAAKARQEIRDGGSSELNHVGKLIQAAKAKHGRQDRTYWNYYGDPATTVWRYD